MKTYLLLIGDENGLRDGDPTPFYVRSRKKNVAQPDEEFIKEVIRRRRALGVSASRLAQVSGYSNSYISMVENGHRYAPDEAKERIRAALTRIEEHSR